MILLTYCMSADWPVRTRWSDIEPGTDEWLAEAYERMTDHGLRAAVSESGVVVLWSEFFYYGGTTWSTSA